MPTRHIPFTHAEVPERNLNHLAELPVRAINIHSEQLALMEKKVHSPVQNSRQWNSPRKQLEKHMHLFLVPWCMNMLFFY